MSVRDFFAVYLMNECTVKLCKQHHICCINILTVCGCSIQIIQLWLYACAVCIDQRPS